MKENESVPVFLPADIGKKKTNHIKYLDYFEQFRETSDWSKSRTKEITKAQSLDTYILSLETHKNR